MNDDFEVNGFISLYKKTWHMGFYEVQYCFQMLQLIHDDE
jgi:hypothetical protein